MARRLYAVVNPAAGSGRAARSWERVRGVLAASGMEVEWAATEGPGHASRLARAAAREDAWDAVLAVGGDGTVHEVANGLLSGGVADRSPALAVLPAGSGNDFAATLGLPDDPLEAGRSLPALPERAVDAGRVRVDGAERFFVNGVGSGFDAAVALRAGGIPLLRGTALYGLALLRELLTLSPARVEVELDGRAVADGPVAMVTSTSGPRHGGGFRLCPDARVDDGELDLLVVEAVGRGALLRVLARALEGGHVGHPGVALHRGRRVEIRARSPIPVHVDGEVVARGAREISVEILPGRLRVLAPPGGEPAGGGGAADLES